MEKFPTPSAAEYLALMQLKRLGVVQIIVNFEGEDDSGVFEHPVFIQTPKSKKEVSDNPELSLQLSKAKQAVFPYLERVVFGDHSCNYGIGFCDEGSRGDFTFCLENEQITLELNVRYPCSSARWTYKTTEDINPGSELIALVAEIELSTNDI